METVQYPLTLVELKQNYFNAKKNAQEAIAREELCRNHFRRGTIEERELKNAIRDTDLKRQIREAAYQQLLVIISI